jgi:hypothetical protein
LFGTGVPPGVAVEGDRNVLGREEEPL